MAIAMHHSRARNSTAIAVLVGIANHDGDGGAWPTVGTLAHYARVSERQVQRTLNELIALGEIHRDIQAGGTVEFAPTDRPNLYHFTLKCPPHCDNTRQHRLICQGCGKPLPKTSQTVMRHPACEPAYHASGEGVTPMSPGDADDTRGVPPVTPKPSLEPSINYPREDSPEPAYVGNRARAHEGDASGAALAASAGAAAEPAQAPKIDGSADSHRPAGASAAAGPISSPADAQRGPHEDPNACPRWRGSMPHTIGRDGRCIDCGASVPGHIDTETGEVH
ncbi:MULTISPECIES: helix-turn-helix domain-containing protein [unclassified Leifsonia]|uniref:helix-turn-helix domain-containing protein n=1 Tax=unclassified Leifsonia TaxID=2663824 RepID=UPI000B7E1F66|nr:MULTISPECIES: helix-turn-helix domain-containing protein [unclassified Leifsonia]